MIKFKRKKLAEDWCYILNEEAHIYCEYDGYYNLVGFKSITEEKKAIKFMKSYPKIFQPARRT
jgi:hypothetical protein